MEGAADEVAASANGFDDGEVFTGRGVMVVDLGCFSVDDHSSLRTAKANPHALFWDAGKVKPHESVIVLSKRSELIKTLLARSTETGSRILLLNNKTNIKPCDESRGKVNVI